MNKVLQTHLQNAIEDKLREAVGGNLHIQRLIPVYGGDINQSFRIQTNRGDFFVKINDAQIFPGMFEKEADGLNRLAATGNVQVPEVVATGRSGDLQFLILQYIEKSKPAPDFWEKFGSSLAEMHRHTQRHYGLEYDNYIGSLIQINTEDSSWVNFFIQNRLRAQLNMAINKNLVDVDCIEGFEKLFDRLHKLLPVEFPHLLHGDLWSGNFLSGPGGQAVIIDPAVYYGHREMDLAMTLLFGGFDDRFYAAYNEAFPLLPGWEERMPIYQLYPLLVHLNLFGGSYYDRICQILNGLT